MIRHVEGNILDSDAEAIVNPVNCVGVMGAGLALQFKRAFPANFRRYGEACRRGEVRPGRMFETRTGMMGGPRWIVNFPTKHHWRDPSRLEWIEAGLLDLDRLMGERDIRSVAIPQLGCGLGGLRWEEVRPLIDGTFSRRSGVDISVYGPPA